jgi:serine/threonine protein kinase
MASNESKNLIREMLTYDPDQRMSANDCIQHPWIKRNEVSSHFTQKLVPIDCFNNLRVFGVRNKTTLILQCLV